MSENNNGTSDNIWTKLTILIPNHHKTHVATPVLMTANYPLNEKCKNGFETANIPQKYIVISFLS